MTYTYDGDGERVKKSTGTLYWGLASNEPLAEGDLGGAISKEFIFFGGKRIARLDLSGGAVRYYFSDHLGSSSVVTNDTGATVLEEFDFYPFGGERLIVDMLPNQRYRFTGKERDPETGLDYFGARYYGSSFGRFTSPDWAAAPTAVPYAEFVDPQSLNLYGYVRNNPLLHADPDGHDGWDFALGVAHAWVTNNFGGLGRAEPYNEDNAKGQEVGDKASIAQGAMEIQGAEAGAGGGIGLVFSFAGAPEGAVVLTGSAILGAHGAGTAASGLLHLAKSTEGKTQGPGGAKVGSTDGPGSGKRATPGQREQTLKEDDGKCVFCGKQAEQVDHAVPRSRGGDTTRRNLQPACQACNQQKGAKTTKEYLKWKKKHSR